jgi:2-hydroxy-6-oxonona-2,4-dienedioate hydrolase
MSIFRSPQDKTKMIAWHHRYRQRIGRPLETQLIETSFGETHVLMCGPAEAPPIVIIHGALASSAHAMAELAELADNFRLIGLDVIGQSPMSAETRPEVKGNTYGKWAVECLDALGLESTFLIGVSWGGFIASRVAALAPERIRKLSLLVPAGIVNGHGLTPITKLAIPMMLYRAFPSPARLDRFLAGQLTTQDSDWGPYLGDAMLGFKLDFRPPRLLLDTELAGLSAPVQVFAAEHDVSFPGKALLARAKKVFPNLVHAELLAGSQHCPPTDAESRKRLTATMAAFFNGTISQHPAEIAAS